MNDGEFITSVEAVVASHFEAHLRARPMDELASVDSIQGVVKQLAKVVIKASFEAWSRVLEEAAKEVAVPCPRCGGRRRTKRRPGQEMEIQVLGFDIKVPKLYVDCPRCPGSSVSITRLLTGLHSGDATMELKLLAAYAGSEHSYGKASRDIEVHHGQRIERTGLRRMALEVEELAMEYIEEQRVESLGKLEGEARSVGVDRLMLQADGGSVRTGELVKCEAGDEGFGKTTAKRNKPRRKRPSQNREVITFDIRRPGQMEPAALDVLVPVQAPAVGERSRRMLSAAGRSGLGDNTHVVGLGDLGSMLPDSFDEAFVGYDSVYSGDWKHVRNYVDEATAVLETSKCFKAERWKERMLDAIWKRDERRRDKLLKQAAKHRVAQLPEHLERCPVHALKTYVTNNWHRMNAAKLKAMELDFVSARAESQVRDRTKARFSVPGAWRVENIEGKATLRAIVAEGQWEEFRRWCLERTSKLFEGELRKRLAKAVDEGRLQASALESLQTWESDTPQKAVAA